MSQCCSPGNPVGGTANLSIVSKNKLRMNTYYRYGYADTYYDGSSKSDFQFVENASYNFLGTILTYGLTDRLNIEVELGYFFDKTQNYNLNSINYSLKGFGLRDGVVSLKYNLFQESVKELEFTIGIGAKIPFRQTPQEVNYVTLPVDVQSSDMALGLVLNTFFYKGLISRGLHFFQLNRYEYKFENNGQYQFGQALYSSIFINKSLNRNWALIMQIRGEWHQTDKRFGEYVPSSGGSLFFIVPQINYTINQKWNLSLLTDIPIFRNYIGTQLSPKYAFSILLSREFDFSKN